MAGIDSRLSRCFVAVFPDISEDEVTHASVENLKTWDSLKSLILTTVVEEEFDLRIDPMDLPDLGSYRALSEYLRARLSVA